MRKQTIISILLLLCCCLSGTAIKKSNISVLYLGGQSDWQNGAIEGMPKKFEDPKDFQKSIDQRMASFGQLLRKYFKTVKVMKASDYKPEMSADYDVTIFDGTPPQIVKGGRQYDENGDVIGYKAPGYLPDDFPYPAITIGNLGNAIGRTIGLKNDWYCLCLDADAHHFRAEHPIFNGPFKTTITLKKKPTPEDAYHYQYYYDGVMPDSLMMWEVQTKGYKSDDLFEIGMVARPWGYEDSPDCEYISSGVCAKTLDAIAIGRHGNFLHWGFVASPLFMTEEAKIVFANAVTYIAKFKGTRIARKYNDRIATREYLKELKYLATWQGYEDGFGYRNESKQSRRKAYYAALEKKRKGEKLNQTDLYYLENTNVDDIDEDFSFADQLRRYQKKEIFEMFGEDEKEICEYYDHNRNYFYGGKGSYEMTLDTDVKSMGIPNNDKRLLDRAISDWEQGKQKSRAKRILTRYTLCRFDTPQEWRQWYETYKDRLFFTESGGWLWLVNSTDPSTPGNDYSVLKQMDKPSDGNKDMDKQQPTADNPVIVSASIADVGGKKAVKLLFKMYKGFHIYEKVASSDSYIPLVIHYDLSNSYKLSGDAIMPKALPFGTSGTTIFSEELTIVQPFEGSGSGTAKVIVSYQACDDHVCIPPQEKTFTLPL